MARRFRKVSHVVEGLTLSSALAVLRVLPLSWASALGGGFGRLVGPLLKRHRIALSNLELALPELSEAERQAAARTMWDNLGRNLGEFAHLDQIYARGLVEIEGLENIEALRDDGVGGIFFSAHFGNWELLSLSLDLHGIAPVCIYRHSNSALMERAIQKRRVAAHCHSGVRYHRKTRQGMRESVKAILDGQHLAMLVDQKMNRGIPVPFFGVDAMTAPAIAQIALRYRVPVVPARIERKDGPRFKLTLFPPLELPDTGSREADTREAMVRINRLMEDWIRECPGHWLWAHRRWPAG